MSSKQTKSKSKKRDSGSSAARITDARFASFETDPRYALPSKRRAKTTIDKRFSRMLKDDDFTATAKTDRYGRKVKSDSKKKALQRLYQEEDEDEDEDEDENKEEGSDVEADDDDIVQRELEKANTKYDPARGGGFSSSEDDNDSDSDDDDDDDSEEEQVDNAPDMQQYRTQQAEVETGDVTNRIAIVNIDWDNIKSVDLMALCNSFVPVGGRIEKVSIYPSEFGKERMQREELEGPPKEIFKKSSEEDDDESDSDESEKDDGEDSDEEAKNELLKEENDEDFDSDALRTYQLDRLRYYYAVMICSDINTAQKIYEATDGSEYLSSSNFLDLRFIPDDVTFDDEPRDECTKVPNNYKPVEFVTDALQHSKVKLTWDMHPEEANRKETMKNAFSGSRDGIAENDIKAYLASDSEDEDDEDDAGFGATAALDDGPKLSKKELARRKLREALGLKDEPSGKPSKSAGPVGDMQITFTSALTEPSGKKAPEEETTAEKYIRKERQRKAKRKEMALANRQADKAGAGADKEETQEDLGFDDPFFTAEEPEQKSKSAMQKEERLKKRAAREAEEKQHAEEKAQLQLLMADTLDEEAGHLDHFDMNEIVKAEKNKKKKGKKSKKKAEEAAGLQDDFHMDVEGDRFKAVFEDHEFAIDPSNPKFKATSGMKKLLEEGRKKRKHDGDDEGVAEQRRDKKPKEAKAAGGSELSNLVSSIKKKSGRK